MDINEKKRYEEEGHQIASCIETGDIDTLRKILPTAEDLVKATENCDDYNHDIMDQIALSGNHEMLKKILKAYFSERSEENDDLRRRFLMSREKLEGSYKTFHCYEFAYLPPLQAMKKVILSKTEEEQAQNIQEYKRIYEDFKKPTDDKDKQLEQQKLEVYETIRNAYMEVYPKTSPKYPMKTGRYYTAPIGEAVQDPLMTADRSLISLETSITYPMLRLVNIPKDQNENEPLMCPCFDIPDARFTEGKNDLVEQVFHQMPFPDAWIGDNYFLFLHKFGETYQKIHDDPIADAVVHNFNQNNGYYTFENRRDKTMKGNGKEGHDYVGYAGLGYICLRTDMLYYEGTVFHEGGHNTDDGEFSQTDLYKFVATAIYANPEESHERKVAVYQTLSGYNNSEFERESLARIPEQYFSSHNFEDDPLLKATCDIFSAFGKAKTENNKRIISRINRCMRLRLNGKIGYKKLSHVNDMRLDYFAERIEEKRQAFLDEYKKLAHSAYSATNEHNTPYQVIEHEIIKCINDELKAIKKINQHPLAGKVELDLDTISRDNITEETPLEVLIAKNIEEAQKFANLRANISSEEQLKNNIFDCLISIQNRQTDLQEDKDASRPFNRASYINMVYNIYTAQTYCQRLIPHYFKNVENTNYDEQIINPERTLTEVENTFQNIKMVTAPNPERRILPEMIDNPLVSIEPTIQQGNKLYQINKNKDPMSRANSLNYILSDPRPAIAEAQLLQLLYKEFNPQAKSLPEDLHFASLTKEKIKNGDWQRTVNKYQDQFVKQLEKQAHNSQTQAPISKESSHSL